MSTGCRARRIAGVSRLRASSPFSPSPRLVDGGRHVGRRRLHRLRRSPGPLGLDGADLPDRHHRRPPAGPLPARRDGFPSLPPRGLRHHRPRTRHRGRRHHRPRPHLGRGKPRRLLDLWRAVAHAAQRQDQPVPRRAEPARRLPAGASRLSRQLFPPPRHEPLHARGDDRRDRGARPLRPARFRRGDRSLPAHRPSAARHAARARHPRALAHGAAHRLDQAVGMGLRLPSPQRAPRRRPTRWSRGRPR